MAHGHGIRSGTTHGLRWHLHATTRAGTHASVHVLLSRLHAHHGGLAHVGTGD
jgi:hypothetical protein